MASVVATPSVPVTHSASIGLNVLFETFVHTLVPEQLVKVCEMEQCCIDPCNLFHVCLHDCFVMVEKEIKYDAEILKGINCIIKDSDGSVVVQMPLILESGKIILSHILPHYTSHLWNVMMLADGTFDSRLNTAEYKDFFFEVYKNTKTIDDERRIQFEEDVCSWQEAHGRE
jgi:hypothetical protein